MCVKELIITMPKTNNQVKIGNENFKIWLMRLDPVARVEKMSAIAKTQAATGLKGSLIKASLAQLSQRCQVMLVKLTDREIMFYTRKPSVKRLQNRGSKSRIKPNELDICNKLSLKTVFNDRKKNEPYQSTSKYERSTSSAVNKYNNKEKLKNSEPKTLKRPENTRLEERYKELFGDFDDNGLTKNKAPKLQSTQKVISDNAVSSVLSTTVNVNIYNSSKTEGQNTPVNMTSRSEKSIERSNGTGNNQLKIDVSLNGSNFVEARSLGTKIRKAKTNVRSYKSRKKQRVLNQSKPHQLPEKTKIDQIKSDFLVLSALHNDNSEDDPAQELWKIFGMESPTDRSENIIKSYPLTLNLKDITNNENSLLNVLPHREQANEVLITPTTVSTLDSISSEEPPINKKGSENIENTLADLGNNISKSLHKDNTSKNIQIKSADPGKNVSESFDKEPVCKIAATFSLSGLNTGSLFYKGVKMSKECHETLGESTNFIINRETQRKNPNESGLCLIETISLSDDENDEDLIILPSAKNGNDTAAKELNENQSKVGTIRVKNLGQLLDPQNVPETSHTTEINNIPLQNCNEPANGDQVNTGNSVEDRFFHTYKLSFDELVESKVLKLGEMLHLAVSDEIRRQERIKRAQQLSSLDLIEEETQRTNKDFNELMIVRGKEFAPLFDSILTKFDEGSKLTLFLTLFIRIFHRAKEIDSENGNHILPAKKVIHTMLLKTLSAHEDISYAMSRNPGEFMKQLNLVNKLLKDFHNKNLSQNNIASTINVVSSHVFPTNVSTVTNNMPQDTTNSSSASSTNHVYSEGANATTHPSVDRAISQCVQSAKAGEHVSFQRNSTHRIAHYETKIADLTKVSAVAVKPQKNANRSVIPKSKNLASNHSSIVESSSNRPNSTSTAPNVNANMNNPMSQNTLFARTTHNNVHHPPFQTPDSVIKRTNPEPTHSVVNRLGSELDYIRQMRNSVNPIVSGFNRNVPLAPGNINRHLGIPRKVENNNKRRSSTSQSNMASPGISTLSAGHDVSATRRHSLHMNPSNSAGGTTHTSFPNSNTVQRQPTSIFKPSANTTAPLPDVNKPSTIETNWETQREAITTTVQINPNQESSAQRPTVDQSARRLYAYLPSKTSLPIPHTSNSNRYISTSTSKSMYNDVEMMTTRKERNYQQEHPINIYSGISGQGLKEVSLINSITANSRPLPSSRVETPSSSNSQASSQLIHPTSNAQQYNSTIQSVPASIVSNILNNTAESSRINGRQYSDNVVNNSSTQADLHERDVLASTSSTVKTPLSFGSRTDDNYLIRPAELKERFDGRIRQFVSSSVSTPISNYMLSNASDKGANYGSQQQLRVINVHSTSEPENPPPGKTNSSGDYSNLVAGLELSALLSSQVKKATEDQAIQSSTSKTVYEPPLMSSHLIPVTKEPTIRPDPVNEPVLSVSRLSTINSFNQQECIPSTSNSSMPGYNDLTSSLPSSTPSEPISLNPTQPISSDLTQPTTSPSQSLPMSSHCHPFIRRMPISGKMKMFFGNK